MKQKYILFFVLFISFFLLSCSKKEETKIETVKTSTGVIENNVKTQTGEKLAIDSKKSNFDINSFSGLTSTGYNEKGLDYFNKGEFLSAIELYSKAIELDPNNPYYSLNKATALFYIKNFNDSIIEYTKSIKYAPLTDKLFLSVAYGSRGATLYELFRDEEALSDLNKSLEYNENNIEAIISKTEILNSQKKYDEALTLINKAILLDKNNFLLYTLKGDILFGKKEINESIKMYEKSISLNEKFYKNYFSLGQLYLNESDFKNAYLNFKNLSLIDNKNYINNFYTGLSAYKNKDLDNAKLYFLKALENDLGKNDLAVKLYTLAVFNEMGMLDEVDKLLEEFYGVKRDKLDDILKLKTVFEKQGYKKLEEDLKNILK